MDAREDRVANNYSERAQVISVRHKIVIGGRIRVSVGSRYQQISQITIEVTGSVLQPATHREDSRKVLPQKLALFKALDPAPGPAARKNSRRIIIHAASKIARHREADIYRVVPFNVVSRFNNPHHDHLQ